MSNTQAEPRSDQSKMVGAKANQSEVRAHVGQRQVAIPLPSLGKPSGTTSARIVWFGALGGAAAAGMLSWPVAAAVGLGTVVSERLARQGMQGLSEGQQRTIDLREPQQ